MGDVSEEDTRLLLALRSDKPLKKCEVRALIASGANPGVVDPETGLKPIHIAARSGNVNVLKALLEDDRVRADEVDPRGKVPYEWADEFRHAKAAMLLVQTIIDNPKRYGEMSVRLARHHVQVTREFA